MRALFLAVAESGARYAFATLGTGKRFVRAFFGIGGSIDGAFLIGGVAAVWPTIAHEIPTDAMTTGTTLECVGWATGQVGMASVDHLGDEFAIAAAFIATCVGISQMALTVRLAG